MCKKDFSLFPNFLLSNIARFIYIFFFFVCFSTNKRYFSRHTFQIEWRLTPISLKMVRFSGSIAISLARVSRPRASLESDCRGFNAIRDTGIWL